MTLNLRTLVAIGLIVAGFLLPKTDAVVVPKPDVPKPAVAVVLPDVPDERRPMLSQFYASLGDIVAEDGAKAAPQLKDTTSFMSLHSSALGFAIRTADVGTVPGLGEAIDKAFFDRLGDEVQPLDASVRAKIVEVCKALAWGFENG